MNMSQPAIMQILYVLYCTSMQYVPLDTRYSTMHASACRVLYVYEYEHRVPVSPISCVPIVPGLVAPCAAWVASRYTPNNLYWSGDPTLGESCIGVKRYSVKRFSCLNCFDDCSLFHCLFFKLLCQLFAILRRYLRFQEKC